MPKRIKKIGRPRYVATEAEREAVCILSGNGVTLAVIAKVFKTSMSTIQRYYGDALKDGSDIIRARIGGVLAKAALDGNVNAAWKWLILRGGPEWRHPKNAVPVGYGDDGETLTRDPVVILPPNFRDAPEYDHFNDMSPEARAQQIAIWQRQEAERAATQSMSSPHRALPQPDPLADPKLRSWRGL